MTRHPCKECLLKCNCSSMCDDLIEVGINKRIMDERCCPDCGHTKCLVFNKGYMGIIECCECYSSFFPTSANILVEIVRFRKDSRARFNNPVLTSFGTYIDHVYDLKDDLRKMKNYEDLI